MCRLGRGGTHTQGPLTIHPFQVKSWKWEKTGDGFNAYCILFATLLLGTQDWFRANPLADLPYFLSLALVTIYIGSHRSLTNKQRTNISLKQGVLAPVFASLSILSLYLILKFFPNLNLQTMLDIYFFL